MRDYTPNHTIDPKTGMIESKGYAHAFDGEKKEQFLKLYKANELALYSTCKQLGVAAHTIHKHYKIDPKFKEAFDEIEREYLDELESISRSNARNPKMVIERIFQLKALRPEKYSDQKRLEISVNRNLRAELVQEATKIIDAEVISSDQTESANYAAPAQISQGNAL